MSAAGANPNSNHNETRFHLRQAFKLALSMVLFYWLALSLNWDEPQYGGLAIVIVSLATTGATIEKGLLRVVGTIVGVAAGFLILGLFSHDRWPTMLVFAGYLTVMGYFMQTSRYSYSWYAAAFIPLVVWADTYPHFQSAFYFGTFRFLTTTTGVLIYTMLDLVLWPQRAANQLNSLGQTLWAEVQQQFRTCRAQLAHEGLPPEASDLPSKVAGTLSRTLSTLQDAHFDSADVSRQKKVWEVWRLHARGLVDALEICRKSIDDCRDLSLERLLPGLGPALETLDKRLERIGALWKQRFAAFDATEPDDDLLREPLTLDMNRQACADLSDFERAALMSFVGHLEELDWAGRQLLQTMRILVGIESKRELRVPSQLRDPFQPSRWDLGRLTRALYPTASFIAAFFFWVFVNPPGGPKLVMFAAILALVILRTPMNPLPLWLCMFLSTIVAVAPIYWLVMPSLSTGFGLLSLIFVYSFVFAYLGGRSPALKSGPIIMFVVLTGISNQQSYSFQSLVVGAQMTLMAGVIMTVVYFFFRSLRPEQNLA